MLLMQYFVVQESVVAISVSNRIHKNPAKGGGVFGLRARFSLAEWLQLNASLLYLPAYIAN